MVRNSSTVKWVGGIAVVVTLGTVTAPGRAAVSTFLGSLRIAKPASVSAVASAPSGSGSGRQLEQIVGRLVGDSARGGNDQAAQSAPDAATASRLAGFQVALPRIRPDTGTFAIMPTHDDTITVRAGQLRTMLAEAGDADVTVAGTLDRAVLRVHAPASVEVRLGHCPPPRVVTLQTALQDTPPAATTNRDCVVMMETPVATATVPPGLDMRAVYGVALQLYGMSPDQATAFEQAFDWQSVWDVALPRFLRSMRSITVQGNPGILVIGGSRRGPDYTVLWRHDTVLLVLAGYGSADDAVALADSTR